MGKLFKAVFYVTLFSILTRALGFVMRVYLSRVLGAELLGSYQMAMSVFSVLLTLIASGLPTIIGRTTANLRAKGDRSSEHKFVTSGLIFACGIALAVSAIIFVFPGLLDLIFTSKGSTKIVILLLPGLIASSVYTILRGSLWGQKRFFTISFAEFFEQAARIVILLILVNIPLAMPLDERAALSLSLACVISAIFVMVMYIVFGGKLANPKSTFIPLMRRSTPITAVRTISNVITSAISLIIPSRLMLYGLTASEAMAEYGIIMGMSFPLLLIPGTIIGSIAVTLVPEISEQTTNIDAEVKSLPTLKSQINIALSLSIIVSCLLLPAFIVLGKPIGTFLYANSKAGIYLRASAILMLPMGISQITGSVLNAVGLEMKSLKNSAISAILLFLCIFFLPKYIGVWGLIIGMGTLSVSQSILNIMMLKKRGVFSANCLKVLGIMLLASIPSAILGYLSFNLLIKILPLFFALAIAGVICVGALTLFVMLTNLANIKAFVFKKANRKKVKKGN